MPMPVAASSDRRAESLPSTVSRRRPATGAAARESGRQNSSSADRPGCAHQRYLQAACELQGSNYGRKVGGQHLRKAPVPGAAGAQVAAAVAAPFMQGHAAAALGQRLGKWQVVACSAPAPAATAGGVRVEPAWRHAAQFKVMPATGSDLQGECRSHRAAPI